MSGIGLNLIDFTPLANPSPTKDGEVATGYLQFVNMGSRIRQAQPFLL